MTTIVTIGSGDAVVGHDKDSIGVHVSEGQPNEAVISFAGPEVAFAVGWEIIMAADRMIAERTHALIRNRLSEAAVRPIPLFRQCGPILDS